ncbi:hypothetical protein L7750_19710 [Xenorhabdus bovienii]|uniref:hypothetical protein n=1 Tax=Xenorhabdus bovienii TaxID=40576 RepID=UPI001EE04191|nr:hypothetical protein [Xenorhabdus bovienii]MCG3472505.1 hypothetical protein [Xenorhabdus bovienii]
MTSAYELDITDSVCLYGFPEHILERFCGVFSEPMDQQLVMMSIFFVLYEKGLPENYLAFVSHSHLVRWDTGAKKIPVLLFRPHASHEIIVMLLKISLNTDNRMTSEQHLNEHHLTLNQSLFDMQMNVIFCCV